MTTQLPDLPHGGDVPEGQAPVDFKDAQASTEFQELRRKFRSFAFPMVGAALAWYALYILLAAYAHGFMSIRVYGNITLGIVLGLAQIVTTFAIALIYVGYANRVLDPAATRLRTDLEGAAHEGVPA